MLQPIDDNKKGYIYVKNWRKRTKELLMEAFGGVCGCCNQKYTAKVFEFHHLDPASKDINIGSLERNASIQKLLLEIPKCVMLCANCHREVHAAVRTLPSDIKKFDEILFEKVRIEEQNIRKINNSIIRSITFNKRGCWDKADVIQLRNEGKSWYAIAKLANVSIGSVQKRYIKLMGNINTKPEITWPDDDTLKKELQIKPATHIAEELGVSSSAIKKRCKLRGITTPPRGFWSKQKL